MKIIYPKKTEKEAKKWTELIEQIRDHIIKQCASPKEALIELSRNSQYQAALEQKTRVYALSSFTLVTDKEDDLALSPERKQTEVGK